jgi:hypothetical protein
VSSVDAAGWSIVMTVTTQGGAVYSIDYRDLDGRGKRLAILRHGGPDDPPESNKPMDADRWYLVSVLTPLPPEIATQVAMVLDPVEGDEAPIVRYSTMVMSVVGTL